VQKPQNSLMSSEYPKLRRGSIFICAQARTHGRGARRNKTKVEAFEKLEFFQVWEERSEAREEKQLPLDSAEEIWTVEKISHPGGSATEECTGERIWTVGSWSNYPSAIGSDRSCTRFKLRE
jgi:hypothetical protein